MIRITPSLVIDPADIRESFVRASGPGGQNVNKVSTAVELRFNIANLPEALQTRVRSLAGRLLAQSGDLVISAQAHRSQDRNREDALRKLVTLLRKATERPKRRIATAPSRASKARRLESKARRSHIKALRQSKPGHDD